MPASQSSGGSADSVTATTKSRTFSHVLLAGRPRYTPNSATSSPLPPGPSLVQDQYGGPKLQILSRAVVRNQVRFQLGRVTGGVTTLYPEYVPLERLFDFVSSQQLQTFEHQEYAVEEEQERLRKAAKRRGRPPGSKKKHTDIGPLTQTGSGHPSKMAASSEHTLSFRVTSETDPLQREPERGAIEKDSQESSGNSHNSSEATYRSTRSHRSGEVEQGRYQMVPPQFRQILQSTRRSPTTSPAPLKTVTGTHVQREANSVAKGKGPHRTTTAERNPSTPPERINNKSSNRHVFRPELELARVSSPDNPNIIDLEDTDNEESMNSEALLYQFHGQSVQSLKQRITSAELIPKQPYTPKSESSPVPAPSTTNKHENPSKPSPSTPRTTKRRKRRFARQRPTSKCAEEDDWLIERIISHRKPDYPGAFNYEYLIKWQDHSHEENTWQSEDSLVDADKVLKNYRARIAVEGAGEHGKRWVREVEGRSEGEDDDDTEMSE